MKNLKSPDRAKGFVYLAGCLLLTLLFALFTFLMIRNNSDYLQVDQTGFTAILLQKGVKTTLYVIFTALSALLLASAFITCRKAQTLPEGKGVGVALTFLRSGCGIALLFLLFLQWKMNTSGTPYQTVGTSGKITKVSLALAAIGAFYFLLPLFIEKLGEFVRVLFGFAVVFWCCTQLLLEHFFMTNFLSSPVKVLNTVSFCFLIFYFLSEMRCMIPERSNPGLRVSFGLLTFFFVFGESAAKLILSITKDAGFSFDINAFYTAVKLLLALYALVSILPSLISEKEMAESLPGTARDENAEGEVPEWLIEEAAAALCASEDDEAAGANAGADEAGTAEAAEAAQTAEAAETTAETEIAEDEKDALPSDPSQTR